MHTKPFPKLQAAESSCRINHFRLNVVGVQDSLREVLDLLSNGELVAGKHLVEVVLDHIEDTGREEIAMIADLADCDPVWRIDKALNERRKKFLDDCAKKAGAVGTWAGDAFEMTWDTNFVRVDPKDNWTASSGLPDVELPGIGLTALHAHLTGKLLPESIDLLAEWLRKQDWSAGK